VTPTPPALPPLRPPRSLAVHFVVDAAVCFLGVIVVGLILGIGWVPLLVVSLVVGACVAPFTRRAEERALAARAAARASDPGADPR
jgi:hypothetical protein